MTTYKTLYSRTSTGAIQVWFGEAEEDRYRTVSGQLEGIKTYAEWTTCEGKNIGKSNETRPEEQCVKELEALYTKKLAADYFESIEEIDKPRFISPMLAKSYENRKDEIDWTKGVYISPKMDGLRAVITRDGAKSRNGKLFTSFPHILRELEPLFKAFPKFAADGEIYTNKLKTDFNKIISLAKKSKPTEEDFIESEQWLEYHIFDAPMMKGGYHERYTELKALFEKYFKNNKWIKLCPHKLIKSELEVEENLQKYIEEGFEGLMVNLYDGDYEFKRSPFILKYKLFQDFEAEIIDITEGRGNRSGMFGFATLKMDNGKTFDANARGTEAYYTGLLKNKSKYIGQKATVRYQNLTPDGIPRFPVIIGIRDYE